jgi:hypothetical protein
METAILSGERIPGYCRLPDLDRALDARVRHPNAAMSMELCGWGRYCATAYTYDASVPGTYMPDLDQTGCLLF